MTEREETEAELIEQVLKGRDDAFQVLIERYENLVWQLMLRMIPTEQDREEVAQDIFLKVYFNLSKFRFDSKFSTWLYTIAYRTALSFLRKQRMDTEPIAEVHHEAVELTDVEQRIARFLTDEIGKLGLDERTTITLFHYLGCTLEEIAQITQKPVGTLKNSLFRVRKKLKEKLESEFGPGMDKVLV